MSVIAHAVFGIMSPFQDEYNDAIKGLKDQLKGLDKRINGKSWLVGNQCTVADIYLVGLLSSAFQTCLDANYLKSIANVTGWFSRVTRLPPFVRAFGFIKPC